MHGPTPAESKAMSIGPTEVDGSRSVLARRSGLARETPLEGSREKKMGPREKKTAGFAESFGDTVR